MARHIFYNIDDYILAIDVIYKKQKLPLHFVKEPYYDLLFIKAGTTSC